MQPPDTMVIIHQPENSSSPFEDIMRTGHDFVEPHVCEYNGSGAESTLQALSGISCEQSLLEEWVRDDWDRVDVEEMAACETHDTNTTQPSRCGLYKSLFGDPRISSDEDRELDTHIDPLNFSVWSLDNSSELPEYDQQSMGEQTPGSLSGFSGAIEHLTTKPAAGVLWMFRIILQPRICSLARQNFLLTTNLAPDKSTARFKTERCQQIWKLYASESLFEDVIHEHLPAYRRRK